jgi:hypothetical protein
VLVSFVLRLRAEELAQGDLVGEVEDVRTGERHVLRSESDLIGICRRASASSDPE